MNSKVMFKAAEKFVVDNAPAILTVVGASGTVATAYLTGKASFKAAKVIADAQFKENLYEKGHELEPKEKIVLVWKCYVPPVAIGVGTVTAIIFANRISSKRAAALAAAYAISEGRFSEYKEKVKEKMGIQKEQKVIDEIAQDRMNNNPPSDGMLIIGDSKVLCKDEFTGRYFRSTVEEIKRAENEVNFEIIHSGYAVLSDFYEKIGLKPTSVSEMFGWRGNERLELSWTPTVTPDGQPCVGFDVNAHPLKDYGACATE